MSSKSIDAEEWETLAGIAAKLDAYLSPLCIPHLPDEENSSYDSPPSLALQRYMLDITSDLQSYALSQDHLRFCVRTYDDSLHETRVDFQQSFQADWSRISGTPECRVQMQRTLAKLYQDSFIKEVLFRKAQIINFIQRENIAKAASSLDIEGGGEWTDETRALMERVYQQHPKLEGHEKKLLAEVSGLSLRQVSIWVSPSTHRIDTLEPCQVGRLLFLPC